jgi:DNA-binding transcriptional regulator YiaG
MIDYELFCKIKNLKEQHGLNPAQIAEELSLDPRTVAKWLEQGRFKQRQSTLKKSKLDPFKNDILRMITAHPYSGSSPKVETEYAI